MAKYTLLKQEGTARRGQFETVHGTVQTPAFMNVATSAAIKGGLSTDDLKNIGCQVMLCNTLPPSMFAPVTTLYTIWAACTNLLIGTNQF